MSTNVFTYRSIKLFILFSAVILILSSCDIVDAIADVFNGEDDDITDVLINSTTIGTDGGIINADELTLTIPADAFSQAVDINIYESSVDDGSIDDIATKVYKIEGLPDQYSKPIDVRIKHNGNISEQSYLILQEETFISSLDSIIASKIYFDAVISGDSIKSQLPAITTNLEKIFLANFEMTTQNDGSSVFICGQSNKEDYTTINNHFKIIYHNDKVDATDVILLGQYLEDAYSKIKHIGFIYTKRDKWPMKVIIEDLADDEHGLHTPTYWGLNSYYLRFNRKSLSNQTAMKTTAIHEFFHFVQYFFDNRSNWDKRRNAPDHYWFNEACSVYSEGLVMGPDYISNIRTAHGMQPFYGLQAGSVGNAQNHGYGMSAYVHYLVKQHGQSILVDIYKSIEAGKHVVNAIDLSLNGNLFLDYNEFLKQYAQGAVYSDFGTTSLIGIADGTFDINSNTDILKTFTANYKEFSARFYIVQLGNPNFKDDTSLEISIDQDLCDITVFQFPTVGTDNVLAQGLKSCVVSDLKGLKQQNKRLLVMVTNGDCIKIPEYSPSNLNINVKMEVKVGQEVSKFTELCFGWALETNWDFRTDFVWQEWSFCYSPIVLELTRSGKTYSGSFQGHSSWNPGSAYSGSITFTLRDDENTETLNGQTNIASSVEFTFENSSDGAPNRFDYIITMTDVEYNIRNNGDFGFYIGGIETCDHITFEANSVNSQGTLSFVVDYRCQYDSRMGIGFYND